METKQCSRCRKILSVENFNKHAKKGYQAYCRPCRNDWRRERYATDSSVREKEIQKSRDFRAANPDKIKAYRDSAHAQRRQKEWRLNKLYGLSLAEYERMITEGCSICGAKEKLVVDHCHDTQKVRGILCDNCNVGIGRFKDDPELVRKALTYLRKTRPILKQGARGFLS